MLCEICKKQYAVTSRVVDKGYGEAKVAVCNNCAINIDHKVSNINFIDDFWGTSTRLTKCGVCNTTLEEILKTGYVGCATCYKIFEKDIRELVLDVQGKSVHVGKVPLTIINKSDEESDVAKLMERALQTGDLGLAEIVRNHFPGKRRWSDDGER